MQILSFIFGLMALFVSLIAFIPLIGWFNWLNIPFAILGFIFGLIGVAGAKRGKGWGIAGMVLCAIAIVFGILKLQACGGFI